MRNEKDIRQNRMKVWAEIQLKVTGAMQDSLMSPIIELELEQALSNNSCPRVDGLTPKFYKKYWGILKEDLRDAYYHMFKSGEMFMSLPEGLIYLYLK